MKKQEKSNPKKTEPIDIFSFEGVCRVAYNPNLSKISWGDKNMIDSNEGKTDLMEGIHVTEQN